MKVKEEDLRRELLKEINGDDLIINCARRLGIRFNNFKCKLYTARIHGIESILEGFNSKISIIKNRARGFRNMKNFMDMIYFCCGDLDICF